MASPAASPGVLKFLNPKFRPQSTDIQTVAAWGIAATTTALWMIQPFDWLKRKVFEKPKPEGKYCG